MGTNSQDSNPINPPAPGSRHSAMASKVPSVPLSIAPKALAENLDDGWGDDADSDATSAPEASATVQAPPTVPPTASSRATGTPANLGVQPDPGVAKPEAEATAERAETEAASAKAQAAAAKADAAAKASLAAAKASNAVSAMKARKAAGAQGTPSLQSKFALPRAAGAPGATEPEAVGGEAKAIPSTPQLKAAVTSKSSPPAASSRSAGSPVAQAGSRPASSRPAATVATPSMSAPASLPATEVTSSPASAPPPADDTDWDVPSPEALARKSVPPIAAISARASSRAPGASTSSPPKAGSVKPASATIRTSPETAAATSDSQPVSSRPIARASEPPTDPKASISARSVSIRPSASRNADSPARPVSESVRPSQPVTQSESSAAATPEIDRESQAPTVTPPKVSSSAPQATEAAAAVPEISKQTDSDDAPASSPQVPQPAIDITIEPSFPQGAPDNEAPSVVVAAVATVAKAESVRPRSADRNAAPSPLEHLSSMSPVTAPKSNSRGKVKIWMVAAAGIALVGGTWGAVGALRSKSAPPRQGQSEPAIAVAAPEPEGDPAVAAPAAPDGDQATPVAAKPPPTGTADEVAEAPEEAVAAEPEDKSNDKKKGVNKVGAVAAVGPSKASEPTADSSSPTPVTGPGQSSPALNKPISPTSGIIDPRAFPSTDKATTASKVRVEVDPPDTKIAVSGRAASPPYVFDVPKGSRVVLEVAHAGYITRRIVLDGSRELVRIGMIPEPKSQDAAEPAPAKPAKPDPGVEAPDEL